MISEIQYKIYVLFALKRTALAGNRTRISLDKVRSANHPATKYHELYRQVENVLEMYDGFSQECEKSNLRLMVG
jgi:hypothetical protein